MPWFGLGPIWCDLLTAIGGETQQLTARPSHRLTSGGEGESKSLVQNENLGTCQGKAYAEGVETAATPEN